MTSPLDPDAARPATGRPLALLLIGVGGTIGTLLRFTLEAVHPAAPGTWPTTTFLINVSGAFLLAVLLEGISLLGPDDGWRRRVRLGVGTGVLGGFTTYSAFMVEAAQLGRSAEYLIAVAYVALTVLLGTAAAWAGIAAVNALHRGKHGAQ
ncbi:MAG: CrcB family protein [Propionibacteriaceae bacterium]|nr:CrcB family protein [Propionibacteriaceae bacterium]